jgi:hypothetical protein
MGLIELLCVPLICLGDVPEERLATFINSLERFFILTHYMNNQYTKSIYALTNKTYQIENYTT